jgi:hypothetical protein
LGNDGVVRCNKSDEISDTPNQGRMTFQIDLPTEIYTDLGSALPVQTDQCTTGAPGIMYMNYMDYSGDANAMFTALQVGRMRFTARYPGTNRSQFCYPTIVNTTRLDSPPHHSIPTYWTHTRCAVKNELLTGINYRWDLVLVTNETIIFRSGSGNSVDIELANPNTSPIGNHYVKVIFWMKRAGLNEEVRLETSSFSPLASVGRGTTNGWFFSINNSNSACNANITLGGISNCDANGYVTFGWGINGSYDTQWRWEDSNTWNDGNATWQLPFTNRKTFVRLKNDPNTQGYIQANISSCGQGTLTACSIGGGRLKLVENYISDSENIVTLAPNPTKDFLEIRISKPEIIKDVINIYSINGKRIITINKDQLTNDNSIKVDLSKVASGIYFLNIPVKIGKVYTAKFIKL